jgi:hypothetical protein
MTCASCDVRPCNPAERFQPFKVQVRNLVRNGFTSKQCVNTHSNNVLKTLGLTLRQTRTIGLTLWQTRTIGLTLRQTRTMTVRVIINNCIQDEVNKWFGEWLLHVVSEYFTSLYKYITIKEHEKMLNVVLYGREISSLTLHEGYRLYSKTEQWEHFWPSRDRK